jgi:hypothetical protein
LTPTRFSWTRDVVCAVGLTKTVSAGRTIDCRAFVLTTGLPRSAKRYSALTLQLAVHLHSTPLAELLVLLPLALLLLFLVVVFVFVFFLVFLFLPLFLLFFLLFRLILLHL